MVFLAVESGAEGPSPLGWFFLALLVVGTALMLYCVFTIYRNQHFDEVHKLGWLLLALMFPILGPLAWIIRSRLERVYRESAEYQAEGQDAAGQVAPAYRVHRPTGASPLTAPAQKAGSTTSDSPENPHLVQRQDGSRGLTF